MSTEEKLDGINNKLDTIANNLDSIDSHLAGIENHMAQLVKIILERLSHLTMNKKDR